uniref:Uncharacterized protein n=1 Tax=Knipowitschia caucasica TaxID=637954 RepID=A0AAV2JFP6_KNICA
MQLRGFSTDIMKAQLVQEALLLLICATNLRYIQAMNTTRAASFVGNADGANAPAAAELPAAARAAETGRGGSPVPGDTLRLFPAPKYMFPALWPG